MATELGQAYVQIMPSAKGISGSIQKAINPEAAAAGKGAGTRIASSISQTMGSVGSTLTKAITLPVAGAATAVAGLVGALGFKRLVGLDTAQAKLKGLGYSGKEVERISGQVENAIAGGMTTMGEGVSIAAGGLAAGVKEGAALENYIKLVGDAAVGANRPVDEMAQIFNRVQGGGRLMTRELNMIEMGLPGFAQAMADNVAGGSIESFRDMVTAGEVSSDQFLNVMDDFAGGMASAYSESWEGMVKNTLAYVGIIGESLLEGLFKDGKKGLADFIEVLQSEEVMEWAQQTGEKIRDVASKIVEVAQKVIEWWNNLSSGGKKVTGIFAAIAIAIGPILLVVSKIVSVFLTLLPLFKLIGAAISALVGAISWPVALIVAAIIAAVALIYVYWEPIKGFFIALWNVIKDAGIAVWDWLKEVWSSSVEFLKTAWEGVSEFFLRLWEVISEIFMIVWEPIQEAWQAVSEFFTEIWMDLVEFFTELWEDIKETMLEVWEPIQEKWQEIVELFTELWTGVVEFYAELWNAIVEVIVGAWNSIIDFITPIIEFINTIISAAWQAIQVIISTVMTVIKTYVQTYWNIIKTVIQTVMTVIKTVIQTAWNVIKTVIQTVINVIKTVIQTAWNVIKAIIQGVMSAIRGDVSGVWNAIKSIVSSVMSGIRSVITSIWNGIKGVISSVLNGIRSTVSSIFNGLRGIVSGAMSGVRSAVSSGIRGALSAVTGLAGNFRNAGTRIVTSIADGIRGAASKVTSAVSNLASKIRDFLPFSPPKTGPLMDIMDVKWGETIGGGIAKGEGAVAKAMEEVLDFDLTKKARFNNPNASNSDESTSSREKQPIILQVDGKTFAEITGDYTSAEGGKRIRRIERGLA